MKLKDIFHSTTFIILFLLLICIDFVYPVTFTFDSSHYMSYLDVLNYKVPWSAWDPVRGFVFPYFLKMSFDIFGFNQNALLITTTLFHIILFLLSTYLVLEATHVNKKISQNLVMILVYIFIAVDPLIMGFYHTILTEFLASAIAVLSCVAGYVLIKNVSSPLKLSNTILLILAYFCLAVPLAWHLKQPYVGAAWFPLLIASGLIIIRIPRKSTFIQIVCMNIILLLILVSSIILWNRFLPNTGEASNPDRKIETYLGNNIQYNINLILSSPKKFVINYGKNYLALANIFTYDTNYVISKKISFIRGHENNAIGYRMYQLYGEENIFYMGEAYRERLEPLITKYDPPVYLNYIQLNRRLVTNFLFSSLYAILPLVVVGLIIIKLKYYKNTDYLNISLLCTGSALMNIIEHAFINIPIDRYIFWGYPLLLIFVIIFIIKSTRLFK